ncbi:hypothetical protein F5883DRAFT_242069 [Diaporthe sp. PMI_573]|nr:hypothetical protein F5883DRAFT_242069 [Diaporthaceae sp. PMI_573]
MPLMSRTSFNFRELDEVFPALRQCAISNRGMSTVNHHLAPLRRLGTSLGASACAIKNMEYLGTGFEDLVVFLLEPSDKEQDVLYHQDISGNNNYCDAIRLLDQSLRFAFEGQRNIKNTIVLDVRPLRSDKIRSTEQQEDREIKDTEARNAVEESLAFLRPKVIVICQCDDEGIKYLCSSVSTSGTVACLQLPNGHNCIVVSSFHPMFFARTGKEKPLERVMREYLFDANLIVAANALVGRTVSGFGIANLRDCALHGPAFRVTPGGVGISYQWIGPDDVTPSNVLEQLAVIFGQETSWQGNEELDKLLQSHRNRVGQNHAVYFEDVPETKQDVLDKFGCFVSKLPKGIVPWADSRTSRTNTGKAVRLRAVSLEGHFTLSTNSLGKVDFQGLQISQGED